MFGSQLYWIIGVGLILLNHNVQSCSSKTAQIMTTTTTTTTPQPKSYLDNGDKSGIHGVWEAEGDHSAYMSSSIKHRQQDDELSASPANGHNEDLLLKPLPTQDGISQRLSGSVSDDDEDSSSTFVTLSSNDNPTTNLLHFGHKNKPLSLLHFSNKSIQCNDKTTAGYYVRKSHVKNSNIWIIFLEGGWYCFDERSCQNRWLRLKNLMSSSGWTNHKHVGGILSSDPNENPYWWNANHVFVPYCSSDTWSGTTQADANGSQFSFMGALIIDEVIKNLIRSGGLRADSTVILAGSSAGGTGVLINLDRVEELLNEKFGNAESGPPRVRGISDSGWFIDKLPSYSEKVDCHDVILCPPKISLKKGMNLWNARLPENCQNSYPDEPWSCFFGYRIYPTLKASLFVFQWLFDEAQMLVNNVPTPALKKEEWDYVYRVGDELKKTLKNVTNVFIPACIAHTVLTHRDWRHVEVNSVYLPRALKCWESGGIIEESNFIPSSRTSQGYYEDESDSSLSQPSKRRNPRLGNRISLPATSDTDSTSDIIEVVNSNDSSRRNRHRHNRHRQKQSNSSKRERRKRRKKLEQDKLEKSQQSKRQNLPIDFKMSSNLNGPVTNIVRQRKRHNNERLISEDRESTRNNNRPLRRNSSAIRNKNRRNSSININSSNSTSDNSHNSIRISNNHLRSRNNNDNNNSNSRNRRKPRARRWFSVCDAANTGVNSGGGGDIRLIEKCSWPQCNKSCPKLLNPLTGEEVDFKDLLKSFGLDMNTMAKALGIDLATLNSMDHQVLLQMLTQHA